MTTHAIIGARSHRSLAQVWRRVRALPPDTTLWSSGAEGIADVAAIAARQAGLAVVSSGRVDACDAFPWVGPVAVPFGVDAEPTIHPPESPALLVFSAHRDYRGPNALDITRGSGAGDGLAFAPSREILDAALAERAASKVLRDRAAYLASAQLQIGDTATEHRAREASAAALLAEAEQIEADAWAAYVPRFTAEMRISAGLHPRASGWMRVGGVARPTEDVDALAAAWRRGVRPQAGAWRRMLGRSYVVILCYCTEPARCHRALVRGFLARAGAVDGGEV